MAKVWFPKEEITPDSQLPAIYDLLVQSFSPLNSFTCKAKPDRNLRPLNLQFLWDGV